MKLVCFDLDGTIVDDTEYIWYTIHEHLGIDPELVRRWHDMFLEGKISYGEWFQEDIRWWKAAGARKSDLMAAVGKLKLMQGAHETITRLKEAGKKVAVISGSLNTVIEHFFPESPFDYVFINKILFDASGDISGFEVSPFDFEHKARAVRNIAAEEGILLSECAFVGDNSNDIQAVKTSGLGISFNSKSEELDSAADIVIKDKDLREVLKHVL